MDAEPEVMPLESLVDAAPTLSADAAVFVPAARPPRVLVARHSRERTPPPRASLAHSSSTACPSTASIADPLDFAVGSTVIFTGLVSRADLVDKGGTVLSFDEASSRFAIKVNDTGESVKVLARNLMTSS
jgi:inactivated superfamily I helicase